MFDDNVNHKYTTSNQREEITFILGKSWSAENFNYRAIKHSADTCDYRILKDLNIISLRELWELETRKYKKYAAEQEILSGIRPPPLLSHDFLDVFLVEKLEKNNLVIVYQVDWIHTVK